MLVTGIQFTAGQHQLQLLHQQRKSLVHMTQIYLVKYPGDTGPVSQVMQAVSLLDQTSSEVWCRISAPIAAYLWRC